MITLRRFLFAAGLVLPSVASAEPVDRTVMIGGQLGVTAEPSEVGGSTISVNVLPLVVEWAASEHIGVRAYSVLNLQFSGPDTGFAHRGGGFTLPVYLPTKRGIAPHQGFYAGPLAAFTTNPLVDGNDLTLGTELGFRSRLGDRGHLNLAGQVGASRLERPAETRWVNHLGFFPSIGVWL